MKLLKNKPKERDRRRNSGFILLLFGIIAIVFSLISASTILAFIGLTLTFWGFLFLFALTNKYVKSEVLESMSFSSLSALDKIIEDSNRHGKGVYLPPYPKDVYVPQHLRELRDGLVFICAENIRVESIIEQIYLKNFKGLRFVPPGLSLANLLEKESDVNFVNVQLDFLMDVLPSLLTDNLEIVEDFKIILDKGSVHVQMSGLACENLCKKVSKLTNICSNLGCPLCSSIACILTKVTNKPVVIERCRRKNNMIETWYQIYE